MKTHAWQRTISALLFLPLLSFVLATYSSKFLLISLISYLMIAITITAGYHRYYSHGSYKCSKVWQYLFGYIGTASLNTSPLEWASVHRAHHKFSDTENDPHESTWRHFLDFKDRTGITAPKSLIVLLRDPVHRFFVNNSALIALVTAGILLMISFEVFLFVYMLPISAFLFNSYLHNILAHTNKQPRNLWALEFIIPLCGEWAHRLHHDNPRLEYFNVEYKYIDIGGYFIRLVRNDQ